MQSFVITNKRRIFESLITYVADIVDAGATRLRIFVLFQVFIVVSTRFILYINLLLISVFHFNYS